MFETVQVAHILLLVSTVRMRTPTRTRRSRKEIQFNFVGAFNHSNFRTKCDESDRSKRIERRRYGRHDYLSWMGASPHHPARP